MGAGEPRAEGLHHRPPIQRGGTVVQYFFHVPLAGGQVQGQRRIVVVDFDGGLAGHREARFHGGGALPGEEEFFDLPGFELAPSLVGWAEPEDFPDSRLVRAPSEVILKEHLVDQPAAQGFAEVQRPGFQLFHEREIGGGGTRVDDQRWLVQRAARRPQFARLPNEHERRPRFRYDLHIFKARPLEYLLVPRPLGLPPAGRAADEERRSFVVLRFPRLQDGREHRPREGLDLHGGDGVGQEFALEAHAQPVRVGQERLLANQRAVFWVLAQRGQEALAPIYLQHLRRDGRTRAHPRNGALAVAQVKPEEICNFLRFDHRLPHRLTLLHEL